MNSEVVRDWEYSVNESKKKSEPNTLPPVSNTTNRSNNNNLEDEDVKRKEILRYIKFSKINLSITNNN